MKNNFDDIRPYESSEVASIMKELIEEKQFMKVVSSIFPLMPKSVLKERIVSVSSIEQFQKEFVCTFLKDLEANKTKGVGIRGVHNLVADKDYLYISNHRDIVLDSAFLCMNLIENGRDTVEIAIGDNLLIFPWIKHLVRINKSFVVKRGLNPREMLESSKHLSEYIRYVITQKGQSIWLAQREGRAKDADDRTQHSLLKMLSLYDSSESFVEKLKNINICPLTISYEYDPCDYLKAEEFQQKRDDREFKKSRQDDLNSMKIGVLGYKGKVNYHISECINDELDRIAEKTSNKNEQVKLVAELIDEKIHSNYTIYPINKWSYDKLNGSSTFVKNLSAEAIREVEKYFEHQLGKIELPNADTEFLQQKMLEMYANPLKNKIAVLGLDNI